MKKYKTGLVLSGGGTRGFAHLGVIAALFEKGIRPDVISGASAGAIVGTFIASGKTPEEIMAIFNKGWFFKYTNLHLPVDGMLKLNGLKEVIQQEIPYENIEDLPVDFFVSVSNLNLGKVEYRNSGPLDKIVLASSSIPVLFSPVKIDGQLYVDGGLVDNIPVEPIKNDCEHIVAVNISPLNPRKKFKNLIQIATRTFYMSVNANMNEVKKYSSVYIEPEGIDSYDILSLSHANELYELGYNSLKNAALLF
ncbi:NTE family protein [Mariniphaga anaerophila]|uniref:NTE family protein n=1 Tax=Mariniphaga anaerophila TaxID=1484053 RepID=A0A1M4SJ70_9BACT|nr:patatin-like phospholipase family protein [Mariniphaga anaerophila]SHE32260.1 NTE family protein [Mariniphaga anaerophila]